MADPSADAEVMDIQESNQIVTTAIVHSQKENGFFEDDSIKANKTVSKTKEDVPNKDVISKSPSLDISMQDDIETIDELTDAVELIEENKNTDNDSLEQDESIKSTESNDHKESNGINNESELDTNHKDSQINNKDTPMDIDSSPVPKSSEVTPASDVEASEAKPNSTPERLLDGSPKHSPELIVADVGPVASNGAEVDESKIKNGDKEESSESSSKVADEPANISTESKEKEPESSTKSESKTDGESGKSKKEGESGKKKKKTCAECGVKKKLQLRIVFQGKAHQLCSEVCYKNFKIKKTAPKPVPEAVNKNCGLCQNKIESGHGYFPVIGDMQALCSEDCIKKYHEKHGADRNCSQCKKKIESAYNQLNWETMMFCNEDCLGKYQSFLGSHCTCCQSPVQQTSLGKYCVCFGADIRQFCSGSCLEEFKKGLKVCSFCQTDLSAGSDGFLAPVGDKGQFKDFCSQQCMERYENMNNISKSVPDVQECSHCKKQGSFKTQVKYEDKTYSLCCEVCVAGFRCSHNIKDKMCDTCYKFFKPSDDENFSLKFENSPKHFCTKACMTLFVLSHRKIIQCVQCKVKKYTFDMIEKLDSNNHTQVFCSLNCLSLFRVNISATSSKNIRCDNCTKNIPAQYHLTMSDGSVRNFCTYNCVLLFQNQFATVPALTTSTAVRQPNPLKPTGIAKAASATNTPVIANVVSLAQSRTISASTQAKGMPQTLVSVRQQGPSLSVLSPKSQTSSSVASTTLSVAAPSAGNPAVVREIVVRPPVPKSVKNKSASCKPIMQTKGVNAKLQTCHKAVQTDERPMPIILPVPVPIYVPTPMHMFSRPVPCPVPFPVPIPIPILVQSPKTYKEIQAKLSSKLSEANLSKDVDKPAEETTKEQRASSPAKTINHVSDEDTSELTSPSEGLAVNNSQSENVTILTIPDSEENSPIGIQTNHGHKRAADFIQKEAKKIRLDEEILSKVELAKDGPEKQKLVTEYMNTDFEDTDKTLKYRFGVNAWKQWTREKMRWDKSPSRKLKFYRPDILQLTPAELNYALSQFTKEIRTPTGEEYTAGALFYILLGLQLYLHENGRTDNIFADGIYDAFTDTFHDFLLIYESKVLVKEVPWSMISEELLWNSRQLGAHSPQVLINTLIYFNIKYFKMKNLLDHRNLRFPDLKRETHFIRYNGPTFGDDERDQPYIQPENPDPLRCPVRLYDFYVSKCPIADPDDPNTKFYLSPAKNCTPDHKLWYSSEPLPRTGIAKTFQRMRLIQEVEQN